MNKKIYLLTFLLSFMVFTSYAQLSDIARIDYTILPRSGNSIEYNRVRALFNYPIRLKKEGSALFLGLDYSNINFFAASGVAAVDDDIDGFQLLDFNIGYTQPLKNDWRLGVRITPGFSSNLEANDLTFQDLVLSADAVFIKDKTKDPNVKRPWRIITGVSYSGNRGFPFPLPFLSYYRKFRPNWSYNFGIPKTNLQYFISEQHRLKLYAELDGFTSNLQGGVLLNNTDEIADSINFSLIVGGLQYEFHIIDHVQFYARTSYVISANANLRDDNNDNIKALDTENSLYLRTGLRLKI